MQLGPDAGAGVEGQQPHGLAAVAERQDEQPRAAVLARLRVAHHRPFAVVDLGFFSWRGVDDARGLRRSYCAAQLAHVALARSRSRREAVVVDQVLVDAPWRCAPRRAPRSMSSRYGSQALACGAARRGASRRHVGWPLESVDTSMAGFDRPESVDTSLAGFGGGGAGRPRRPDRDPGRLQIRARRLAAYAGRVLDPPQRPSQPPQRQSLAVVFSSLKTLPIPAAELISPACVNVSSRYSDWPVFRCPLNGRFWVSTEAQTDESTSRIGQPTGWNVSLTKRASWSRLL